MDLMYEPRLWTIKEALKQIHQGTLTAAELVQTCSRQIQKLNSRLNAFITVVQGPAPEGEASMSRAAVADRALGGIPLALKDLFDTANLRTTAGSKFFMEHVPAADAWAVARLKDAGAVIMGKTNTHEIALGVTTNNPHFGPCLNPWDDTRIPGGSSGGSAVAVATGMALGALGTDTGGSIRIPASLCGVVGLKPTYGRVSVRGVFPLSWNLDHVGPITRSVADAAIMLQVISGYDEEDPYSIDAPVDDYDAHLDDGIRGWRIALGIGEYADDADDEVRQAVGRAAGTLEALGAQLTPVDVSFLHQAALANGLMTQADGAAFHRKRLAEHPDWFGEDVRRRLESGRDLPSGDYVLARQTQAEIKHQLHRFFAEYDILLLPSTPITAPPIKGEDAVAQARRLTRFTAPFNLAGLPAISLPCGFDPRGLPIGLQMIAEAWREAALLRAAAAYERQQNWAARRPPSIM
jgi:aspartyl-tRNA(Asn)/glutamyl-tRNA(Gln) amidotransferase subunit A